jgi:hypothetical protein
MIVMMMGEEDLEKFDKEVQAGSGSPQSADCISIENAGLAACLTNGSSQERDASAITVSTTPTYEPPPNGGLTAWLQVVGSFFLFFNTWSVRFHLGVIYVVSVINLLVKFIRSTFEITDSNGINLAQFACYFLLSSF